MADEDHLWDTVRKDPTDFQSWTLLVGIAEKNNDIKKIRQAYDGFLTEYPLCYVYWKKYAEAELRFKNEQKAIEVYERGVRVMPYCVDLWTYFATHVAERSDDLDYIRSVFERAVTAVGADFFAHVLWDKYIEFEVSQQEPARVTNIFHRVLEIPLIQSKLYWEKYLAHASTRSVEEIGQGSREAALAFREEKFRKALAQMEERLPFERIVQKRTFFHVKPIEEPLLENWRNYLAFELKKGDHARICLLFERCLIACANYPEFWKRYMDYLERIGETEAARQLLQRGVHFVVRHNAELALCLCRLEEATGQPDRAREIYRRLVREGNLQALVEQAHMEVRQGNVEAAIEALQSARSMDIPPEQAAFAAIVLSRICLTHKNDADMARGVLETALKDHPNTMSLWVAAVQLELNRGSAERAFAVLERAVNTEDIQAINKAQLWQYYIHLYSELGKDINRLRTLERQSRDVVTRHATALKRKAIDSDGPLTKYARTEAAAVSPSAAPQSPPAELPLASPQPSPAAPAYPYTPAAYAAYATPMPGYADPSAFAYHPAPTSAYPTYPQAYHQQWNPGHY